MLPTIESEWISKILTDPQFKLAVDTYMSLDAIDPDVYVKQHYQPMVDLGVDIDLDLFNREVDQYKDSFEPWGINNNKQNRFGLDLTGPETPIDSFPQPGNWPLDIWTAHHPDKPLFDATLTTPTKYFDKFKSLYPIYELFDGHIARTNVVWWNKGGEFHSHIDCVVERALNYRVWISNSTGTGHPLLFSDRNNSTEMKNVSDGLVPGRLYLLDTSVYHNGWAAQDNVYSMLMSLLPSASDIITDLINENNNVK